MRASSDSSAVPAPRRRRTSSPARESAAAAHAHAPAPAPTPPPAPAPAPAPASKQPHDDWAWLGPHVPSGWPLAPLLRSRAGVAAGLDNLTRPHRIPTALRVAIAAFLRLWWAALLITLTIVLAVKTHKGEVFTAFRALTYPRVDPTAALPFVPAPDPGIVLPGAHLWDQSCPGPLGVPFPYAPTATHTTPASHPAPAIGDHLLVGQHPDQCTTYEARYAPYVDAHVGARYRLPVAQRGPTSVPSDAGVPPNHAALLAAQAAQWDQVDAQEEVTYKYDSLYGLHRPEGMGKDAGKDRGNLQWEAILRQRLYRQNRRAELLGPSSYPNWRDILDACYTSTAEAYRKVHPIDQEVETSRRSDERDAIVLRAYEGFVWREDDVLNLRALIVEAGLGCAKPLASHPHAPSPSESSKVCVRKDIRILIEAKNTTAAVFTSEAARLDMLRREVPIEFWGLVEFWSVAEMKAVYPGLPGAFLHNMAAQDSYRACFMPLQKLHLGHPEYSFVWNWEMDVRSLDNYHSFLQGVEEFSRREPLDVGMHKYDTWYVRNSSASEAKWDPQLLSTHAQVAPRPEQLPPGGGEWAAEETHPQWVPGVGKEADLISLAPLFDPRGSGWFWEYDVANYPLGERTPRRASIGTNVRLSRELLKAMNVVNAEAKKSLHCEAWPPTLVLHSQLPMSKFTSFYPEAGFTHELSLPFKGVAVPHPIYMKHEWDPSTLESRINKKTFYSRGGEKVQFQSSHYFNAVHAKEIYRTWRNDARSCRAPALLHPIKRVD